MVKEEEALVMRKGKSSFSRTKYGSYIPDDMDGMAAEKNASSFKELLKRGYFPVLEDFGKTYEEMSESDRQLWRARDKYRRQAYKDQQK